MPRLVLASNNAGKLREFSALLADLAIEVRAQRELGIPDAVESGQSFVENALLKARHAARLSGLPALADDSGIEVDHLRGAPGIYSARFAGAEASDEANNRLLLQRLAGVTDAERTARYHCVLVLMRHAQDPTPLICQASWEGRVLSAPRGLGGFGYDPLFWVPDLGQSAAELDPALKNRISHRGQAMARLRAELAAGWPLGN